jgi:hypothetical protein
MLKNLLAAVAATRRRALNLPFLVALFLFAIFSKANAQTVSASATILETATSASFNTFVLTLENTSPSSSIETFWFAWVPGKDFLDSDPLSVQTPSGWTFAITHGGTHDGYAIQFSTSTDPLSAGSDLTGFGFTTADSLTEIEGDSNFYSTTPVTTSEVSTGPTDSGIASSPFIVAVVPEPIFAPFIVGAALLLVWRRRL